MPRKLIVSMLVVAVGMGVLACEHAPAPGSASPGGAGTPPPPQGGPSSSRRAPVDVLKTDFFAELQKVIEASQPEAGRQPGAVNGYDALMAAAVAAHGVTKALPNPSASDFEAIRSPESLDSLDPEARARARAEALALMDELRNAGVDEHLAKAASAFRFVRPRLNSPERDAQVRSFGVEPEETEPGQRRMVHALLPELSIFRTMARYIDARMVLAAEAGRWDEFVQGFRAEMAMASALTRQGLVIDRLVGVAIAATGVDRVLSNPAIARLPDDRLRELGETLDAFVRDLAPFRTALDGERLIALDSCRWVFKPDGRIDDRKLAELKGSTQGGDAVPGVQASMRKASVDAVEAIFGEAARRADLSGVERRALGTFDEWVEANVRRNQLLGRLMAPALDGPLRAEDGLALRLVGVRTLIAIERYRRANGAEPADLAALVPGFLPTLPIDPFSDQPLRYTRFAAPDGSGRTFLLYSVGADGQDNAGQPVAEADGDPFHALKAGAPGAGSDFVLNPAPRSKPSATKTPVPPAPDRTP